MCNYMDIKPQPKTEFESHVQWLNRMTAQSVSLYGKKIRVNTWADIQWQRFIRGDSITFPAIRRCGICNKLTTGCCDTSDYENEL